MHLYVNCLLLPHAARVQHNEMKQPLKKYLHWICSLYCIEAMYIRICNKWATTPAFGTEHVRRKRIKKQDKAKLRRGEGGLIAYG